jgi:two-component system, LytTR family, sensor kinase
MPRLTRWILLTAVGAVILAAAFAAQAYASIVLENGSANWWRLYRLQLVRWLVWAALLPLVVAFARRFPWDMRRVWQRTTIWLVGGLVFCFVQGALMLTISHALGWLTPPRPPAIPRLAFAIWVNFPANLATNLIYFALFAAAIHIATSYRDRRAREVHEAQLEARLATAELDVLKMQLQPHFLFNALNTVSSLMEHDVHSARRVLASLGDLLRMSLDELGAQEISLHDELVFLQHYIDIQHARFRDHLRVDVAVADDTRDVLVPSLLLQPLVENAIRHGVEHKRSGGCISISAERRRDRVRLEVRDNGPGSQRMTEVRREGVGLRNTRARLHQLYGDAHTFEAGDIAGGGFAVVVELPFRQAVRSPV